MSVTALGTQPITYRWFHNGVERPGQVGFGSNLMSISNVQESHEGEYRVRVSNSQGEIWSDIAVLTVVDPPRIDLEPNDQQVEPGAPVIFRVEAFSVYTMTYQWYKGAVAMADVPGRVIGTQSNRLQFLNTVQDDEALYHVRITITKPGDPSRTLWTDSREAYLQVGASVSTEIIRPTAPDYAYVGTPSYMFEVLVKNGKGDRTYRFEKDGAPVGPLLQGIGQEFVARLPLNDIAFSDAGDYRCNVWDDRNPVTPVQSDVMTLSVYNRLSTPVIPGPEEYDLKVGESLYLEVGTSGGIPPLTYEWNREDLFTKAVHAVGGNEPFLSITALELEDEGYYYVVVDDAGSDPPKQSNKVLVNVDTGVPAAGGLGIAALAGFTALAGALALRRRKR